MGTRKGLAPFSIPSLPNATVRFTKLNGGVLLNGPKRCDIISPGRMENCSPPISIFKSYAHLDAFEPSSLAIESHSSSTTVKLFLAKLISRVENRWNNERKRNVCFRETIREELYLSISEKDRYERFISKMKFTCTIRGEGAWKMKWDIVAREARNKRHVLRWKVAVKSNNNIQRERTN